MKHRGEQGENYLLPRCRQRQKLQHKRRVSRGVGGGEGDEDEQKKTKITTRVVAVEVDRFWVRCRGVTVAAVAAVVVVAVFVAVLGCCRYSHNNSPLRNPWCHEKIPIDSGLQIILEKEENNQRLSFCSCLTDNRWFKLTFFTHCWVASVTIVVLRGTTANRTK